MKKWSLFIIFPFICSLFFWGCDNNESGKKEKQYGVRLTDTGDVIYKMASSCINTCRSHATIGEYGEVSRKDVDPSLNKLKGRSVKTTKNRESRNKMEVERLMESIRHPPQKYKESHEKITELFEIYLDIHDLLMNPPETMQDFNDLINDLEKEIRKSKEELDIILKKSK